MSKPLMRIETEEYIFEQWDEQPIAVTYSPCLAAWLKSMLVIESQADTTNPMEGNQ